MFGEETSKIEAVEGDCTDYNDDDILNSDVESEEYERFLSLGSLM